MTSALVPKVAVAMLAIAQLLAERGRLLGGAIAQRNHGLGASIWKRLGHGISRLVGSLCRSAARHQQCECHTPSHPLV